MSDGKCKQMQANFEISSKMEYAKFMTTEMQAFEKFEHTATSLNTYLHIYIFTYFTCNKIQQQNIAKYMLRVQHKRICLKDIKQITKTKAQSQRTGA